MLWFSIGLVVLGNIVYHLAQRAIPPGVNPAVATLAAYIVATAATFATLPVLAPGVPLAGSFRQLNWNTVLVGVAIVGIEMGFLLAYRAGWGLSTASITANASVAVILLGIGALAFREPLSLSRALGIGCCLLGLWLINRR